jgi:hypothetical protein
MRSSAASNYVFVFVAVGLIVMMQIFLVLPSAPASSSPSSSESEACHGTDCNENPKETVTKFKTVTVTTTKTLQAAPTNGPQSDEVITSLVSWNRFRQRQANAARTSYLSMDPEYKFFTNSKLAYKAVPVTYDCDRNTLMRVGDRGDSDGGKWICGEYLKPHEDNEPPNVVFSIGSKGDFSFEESMIKLLGKNTKIYTFDCTGKWTPPSNQITFINVCLGSSDFMDGNRQFKSWATILEDLNIKHIDFLKMDIEGFEWVVLPAVLDHKVLDELPVQISFEAHIAAPGGYYKGIDDKSFGQKLARLFLKLDAAGYYVTSNEYNLVSPGGCSEFTLVRPVQ